MTGHGFIQQHAEQSDFPATLACKALIAAPLALAFIASSESALAQTPEPLASGWIMGGTVNPKHKAQK